MIIIRLQKYKKNIHTIVYTIKKKCTFAHLKCECVITFLFINFYYQNEKTPFISVGNLLGRSDGRVM